MYSMSIMEALRDSAHLEPNDTSKDEELLKLSPQEAFDTFLNYEGIIGYTHIILRVIKEIWKVELL